MVVGVMGGVVVPLGLGLFGFSNPIINAGAFGALGLASLGILCPHFLSIPYRIWDRVSRGYCHYARSCLITIFFYVVFTTIGRAGASLLLDRPILSESMWIPKAKPFSPLYKSQHSLAETESRRQFWMASLFPWASQPRYFWAYFLLPFLALLSILGTEHEENFPTGIYTLF